MAKFIQRFSNSFLFSLSSKDAWNHIWGWDCLKHGLENVSDFLTAADMALCGHGKEVILLLWLNHKRKISQLLSHQVFFNVFLNGDQILLKWIWDAIDSLFANGTWAANKLISFECWSSLGLFILKTASIRRSTRRQSLVQGSRFYA